jgi:uncharacterized protein (DUF2384 family)
MPAVAKKPALRRKVKAAPASAKLSAAAYLSDNGAVKLEEVATLLRLSKGQLAESAGLKRDVLQKASRRESPKAQGRIREMLEILQRVQDWAGSAAQALAWYHAEPLPAFGGRTAESLVQSGDAKAVRDYLDHVARGGYA